MQTCQNDISLVCIKRFRESCPMTFRKNFFADVFIMSFSDVFGRFSTNVFLKGANLLKRHFFSMYQTNQRILPYYFQKNFLADVFIMSFSDVFGRFSTNVFLKGATFSKRYFFSIIKRFRESFSITPRKTFSRMSL